MTSNTQTATRYGIGLASAALVLVLAVALLAMGAGAAEVDSSPINVTLDDPDNEDVQVTLNYTGTADVSLELTDGTVIYETKSVSGTDGTIATETIGTGSASADDDLQLVVDSTSDGVSVESSAIVKTVDVNVTDATNETLTVDASFAGGQDATANVTVLDASGSEVVTDQIQYLDDQHNGEGTTLTREYGASDGLIADDLTVEIAETPIKSYEAVYASVDDGDTTSGGLIGGEIAGQDTGVVIGAVVVLGGLGYYGREEGWF